VSKCITPDITHAEQAVSVPLTKGQAIYLNTKLYTHEKTYSWKTKSVKDHKGVRKVGSISFC
jgi:hypothetical protein